MVKSGQPALLTLDAAALTREMNTSVIDVSRRTGRSRPAWFSVSRWRRMPRRQSRLHEVRRWQCHGTEGQGSAITSAGKVLAPGRCRSRRSRHSWFDQRRDAAVQREDPAERRCRRHARLSS